MSLVESPLQPVLRGWPHHERGRAGRIEDETQAGTSPIFQQKPLPLNVDRDAVDRTLLNALVLT